MEFVKHNFKVGDRVTVEQLNEIEDGIVEAAQSGGDAEDAIDAILDGASNITTFKAVENKFTAVNNKFTTVDNKFIEVDNDLSALHLSLTDLEKDIADADENLQNQITANKNSIDTLSEDLEEETTKVSKIEIDLEQVNAGLASTTEEVNKLITKNDTNELLLNNVLDDLGLTDLVDTDFPNEEERISTRALAQYSNDITNILLQELGLNSAISEEYPTQNTKSIRELIDSKLELIKLDINGSYDQETIKQILDAILTNNVTIRLLVGNSSGYKYLDVVSLAWEATEGGSKYTGKTINNNCQVIIETNDDSEDKYSIHFIKPIKPVVIP